MTKYADGKMNKKNYLIEQIVKMSASAGEGHIPSALSILDILWVLYDRILKINPDNPIATNRDRFVLSKGHASLGLYAVLAEKGFFPVSELGSFGKFGSILGGHPDRNKICGVEASTGSLGHGLPMSVGIALGLKIQKIKAKVFTIIGDGEANEGTIWEAALIAAHHKLSNLYCIVDYNHSTDRALNVGNLVTKFNAFGWDSCKINGHDNEEIYCALSRSNDVKPMAVIAETVKGCGCRIMENNPEWHHKTPSKEELEVILGELR
jgi:transketolase